MVSNNTPPKGGVVDTPGEVKRAAVDVLKTFKDALHEQHHLGSDLENLRMISNVAYKYSEEVEQEFLEIARRRHVFGGRDDEQVSGDSEKSIEFIVTKIGAAIVQIWCSDLHIKIQAEDN